MKRTRRIEIVRYSRRVTLTDGEADASVTADGAAAIGILSRMPEKPSASGKAGEDDDPVSVAGASLSRRRLFWHAWLKRE